MNWASSTCSWGRSTFTVYAVHDEPAEAIAPGLRKIGELAAQGFLHPVIDSRFTPDDFEDAFTHLTSRQAIGSIVLRF
ncbi:zinc-binding dehydrogenase [Streptomyces sp. NPDC048581]|uniref:zinc-binding dehydrogenase n=1 Tax=unclassified Streptomyces TaxID=2593676 RepID=UPI00372110EA